MHTLSLKIPDYLYTQLEAERQKRRITKSQLIRAALEKIFDTQNQGGESISFYAASKDLCGSLTGGPKDLSSNDRHMEGYGE